MKKNIRFVMMLLAFVTIAPLHAQKKPSLDKITKGLDAEMNKILSDFNVAGFSVAVVDKNGILFAKGYGYRDLEKKLPADENTVYAIGSCTKAFTTSILGKLEAEEKLSFSDRPAKHIPGFKFSDPVIDANATIEDLAIHRTGIPRHDIAWYLFDSESKDSLVMKIAHHEPFTGLRERWYYNNFMFLTQGVIGEKITGKSWEDNIRELFFAPLGMTSSNVSIGELERSSMASKGYEVTKDGEIKKMDYYNISGMSPAGSINSSVKDMSNWVRMWINGGKYGDKEILPASYVKSAASAHTLINPAFPSAEHPDVFGANYGYGWMVSSYRGHYRVEHGGNIDGFSASTAFYPTDSIGIIVLVNQNGSQVTGLVRNIVTDRFLQLSKVDWHGESKKALEKRRESEKEALAKADEARRKDTKPSHSMPEYTGSYYHPGYGKFTILYRNDSLIAKFPSHTIWLKHYHYDVFSPLMIKNGKAEAEEGIGLLFNFIANASGDISSVQVPLEPTIDPISFKRTPAVAVLTEKELEAFAGDFELGPQKIKFYVKAGVLYAAVAGQPDYELLPTDKEKFIIKALDGFKIEFIKSDDGTYNEAKFIQPNGVFNAIRKKS